MEQSLRADAVIAELDALGNPQDAEFLQRFFKTGDGQYGEGDIFLGIRMPVQRTVAARYRELPLQEIETLLESPIHEHRMAAAIIMSERAKRASEAEHKTLYDLYVRRSDRLNNWDLIDISAPHVVGAYLLHKSREPLYKMAHSKNLWERRIAIVSTAAFIKHGDLADTFGIATELLHDTHDLIHKATGWMLRETGKKDEAALRLYLDQHAATMPRTMLRYAIERLDPTDRQYYMQAKVRAQSV